MDETLHGSVSDVVMRGSERAYRDQHWILQNVHLCAPHMTIYRFHGVQ